MKKSESFSCCIKDGSRSSGFGDQTLESNHPVRQALKACVVSDSGKGGGNPSGAYCGDERK
jgi:hypothetical protein